MNSLVVLSGLRSGWVTSFVGEKIIRIECLLHSDLPSDLTALGWRSRRVDTRMRMISDARTELLAITSSGVFEAATAGSTKPLQRVTHAGIEQVIVYELALPPRTHP
jgi:hypothetical protein